MGKRGPQINNLRGERFGMWEVKRLSNHTKSNHIYWVCICHGCGKTYDVRVDNLKRGQSHKCMQCAANERKVRHAEAI